VQKLNHDEALFDAVANRIERRVTHILSFQIAVDMFHRFLTERENHARLALTDPLDDLVDLEARVASLEESLRALAFDAAADPTDAIAAANTEDESAVRLLESRNIVRRLDISRKKRLQRRPLGPRASRIKLAAAARDAEDGDAEGDIAAGNLKRAQEVAELVAARQQRLDGIDAELAALEAAVDERLQGLQLGHEAKEKLVRRLVGRVHEIDGLWLAINELQDANAKLRGACARTADGGADARRQAVLARCWEEAYDVDKEEIRRRLLTIDEKKQAAARRDQRNRTRAEAIGELAAEVAQREEEADRALKTILAIEGDARDFEKQLNKALREAKELAGVEQGDRGEPWVVAEMEKIFGVCVEAELPK
jgi:hypothetical protein